MSSRVARGVWIALLSLTSACGQTDQDGDPPKDAGTDADQDAGFACKGKHWTAFEPPESAAGVRYDHHPLRIGNEVVFWGGTTVAESGIAGRLASGFRVDPNNGKATRLPSENAPQARSLHSVAWLDSSLLVWGGGEPGQEQGGRLRDDLSTWHPLKGPAALQDRIWQHATVLNKEWAIWGGAGGNKFRRDGFAYNPASDTWKAIPEAPYAYARGKAVAIDDNRLFVWGGQDIDQSNLLQEINQGAIYDHKKRSWTVVTMSGAPEGAIEPLVYYVSATNEVLVWTNALPGPRGARFSLDTMFWKPISSHGAPSVRSQPSTVLVGKAKPKLLIFAGSELPSGPTNSGHIYDVLSDTWSAMPSDECVPSPRASASFTALGDGNSAFLWGGIESLVPAPGDKERGWLFRLEP